MKIRLNEDKRIVGWCTVGGMDGDVVEVDHLPERGDPNDYVYIDGEFVFSPAPVDTVDEAYEASL